MFVWSIITKMSVNNNENFFLNPGLLINVIVQLKIISAFKYLIIEAGTVDSESISRYVIN